jgi:hypothetical protein
MRLDFLKDQGHRVAVGTWPRSRRALGSVGTLSHDWRKDPVVKDAGRAVIIVTHNVLHALDVGDAFVGIRLGRLAGVLQRGCDRNQLTELMGG